MAAREQAVTEMSKDADFVKLLDQLGPPPTIIWITCGNTSNAHLRDLLSSALRRAIEMIDSGESLVEISDLRPLV